ncbi:hypothetical protein KSC_102530 [Ktedonobacter sp. SOSP1-52]|nr:hypothetical protein KSC_102530 [Ktedonobacter sp. SOSP1-52]
MTGYEILEHPHEHGQAIEAVAHHQQVLGHPPHLVAGDRGVHSAQTSSTLQAAGVKLVAIPAAGKVSEERQVLEHTPAWKPDSYPHLGSDRIKNEDARSMRRQELGRAHLWERPIAR